MPPAGSPRLTFIVILHMLNIIESNNLSDALTQSVFYDIILQHLFCEVKLMSFVFTSVRRRR